MPIAAGIANCDLAQMPAALRKIRLRAAQSIARVTGAIGSGSALAAARGPIYAGRQLAMPHYQATFKTGCSERSLALCSMHESASRFARELRALLWLCARLLLSSFSLLARAHIIRHYLPFRTISSNGELLRIQPGIPDRLVQSPSLSRDIVLCLLQTLPEVRGRSLNRVQGSSLLARDLENGAICVGDRAPRRSGRKYPAGDNTLHGGLLCLPNGADGRSQYYVGCDFAHLPKKTGLAHGYST